MLSCNQVALSAIVGYSCQEVRHFRNPCTASAVMSIRHSHVIYNRFPNYQSRRAGVNLKDVVHDFLLVLSGPSKMPGCPLLT